jgi:hypothetical protein
MWLPRGFEHLCYQPCLVACICTIGNIHCSTRDTALHAKLMNSDNHKLVRRLQEISLNRLGSHSEWYDLQMSLRRQRAQVVDYVKGDRQLSCLWHWTATWRPTILSDSPQNALTRTWACGNTVGVKLVHYLL